MKDVSLNVTGIIALQFNHGVFDVVYTGQTCVKHTSWRLVPLLLLFIGVMPGVIGKAVSQQCSLGKCPAVEALPFLCQSLTQQNMVQWQE